MNPAMRRSSVMIAVALAVGALLVAGCGKSGGDADKVAPREIDHNTSCSLDGMLLADYPGPKAQIFYAGSADPDYFCDTVEMFHVYLAPEQVRVVRAIYVQDMGKADWENPLDHWIDARKAYYVVGSKRTGSMGPTIGSFLLQADAEKFAKENGGKVYPFGGVTPEMAVLDGGALHDSNM